MVYDEIVARFRTLLRNEITDPKSRGSDKTDTFTGDGSTKEFQLTQEQVSNVKTCTVGGVSKLEFVDYETKYNYPSVKKATIVFVTAPASDVAIVVTYHYGGTWIHTSYPEEDFASPRISISHISSREDELSLGSINESGDEAIYNVAWYQVDVWVRHGDKATINGMICSGGKMVDVLASNIEKAIFRKKQDGTLKKQGIKDVILRMARDISMTQEKLMRKLMDFEIIYELKP